MKQAEPSCTPRLFPQKYWGKIPAHEVQRSLQRAFEMWGMPQQMRFDNGKPWRTQEHTPTALSLWLMGLNIRLIYGRPRRSTDNAIVERSHGVLNGWVEPQMKRNFSELEDALFDFTQFRREHYPYRYGHTRSQDYPDLYIMQRPYRMEEDKQLWHKQHLVDQVAQHRFHRKVEKNGRVTLMSREYSVDRQYKHQTVSIHMDTQTHEWVVYTSNGDQIARWKPKDFTYCAIQSMDLTFRHWRQSID